MIQCYRFENEEYEIFVEKEVFIKDKKEANFYKTSITKLDSGLKSQLREYNSILSTRKFIVLSFFLFLLLLSNTYLVYLYKKPSLFEQNISNYSFFIIYLFFNIFVHELGHIKSMNLFGRSHNRVGFKMNYYVFPCVYVQLNEIYMLSKREKLFVHSAGIFINLFITLVVEILNILFFHSLVLSFSYTFFLFALLWNMVPILNSDGYKILITLLNKDELENSKKNHWLIKIIQVIGVLAAIRSILLWF